MKTINIKQCRLLFVLLFVGIQSLHAVPEPALKSGDRIIFFGDRIIALGAGPEGCVSPVVAAMALRCPWMEAACLANAGLPGDTAPGGLRRLQTSVLDQKQTVVTFCFGISKTLIHNQDHTD